MRVPGTTDEKKYYYYNKEMENDAQDCWERKHTDKECTVKHHYSNLGWKTNVARKSGRPALLQRLNPNNNKKESLFCLLCAGELCICMCSWSISKTWRLEWHSVLSSSGFGIWCKFIVNRPYMTMNMITESVARGRLTPVYTSSQIHHCSLFLLRTTIDFERTKR